jgi:DNA-3-methyladenine glycosylase II
VKTLHFPIIPAPPFRLDLTVWVLRRRSTNRIDSWDGKTYRRAMLLDGNPALVRVEQEGTAYSPKLNVTVACDRPSTTIEETTTTALDRLLGIHVDLSGFYKMSAGDKILGPVVQRFQGVKPPRFATLFEAIANGIVFQQLSLSAAVSILNRLAEAFGRPFTDSGTTHITFPEPGSLAQHDFDEIAKVGLTVNKAKALLGAAKVTAEGGLPLDELESMDNFAAAAKLIQLPGIGEWTADYVLLRGLGRLDVFPRNDVGANKGLQKWLTTIGNLTVSDMESVFSKWGAFAGMVYFHLLLRRIAEEGLLQ